MERLAEIDLRVRQVWLNNGVSEEEILQENLMDHSWDVLQVGFMLARTHGRIYGDRRFVALIRSVLSEIRCDYKQQVDSLGIAVSRRFRYCDLLQGNDIAGLIGLVKPCLEASRAYGRNEEIPFGVFIRSIREPILLYPGSSYSVRNDLVDSRRAEQFVVTLRFDMEFEDVKGALHEAIYQYAKTRESSAGPSSTDEIAGKLINDFLLKDFSGEIGSQEISRYDGFLSILSGLYCWDRFYHYKNAGQKQAMECAVGDTVELEDLLPIGYDDETIKKNYKKVNKRIYRFMSGAL